MTQNNQPTLILNRLIVSRNGKVVYDENFHNGVNIIRGTNSSGKSTIADFIFFVLGGDFNKWKPEAESCDFVLAEVQINGAILTLRREISATTRQGMYIFWGNLEDSVKSTLEGWQVFPFQRSAQKMNFSAVLFNALGFPEVRGEANSNLTMHQILRLLYIDQLSNTLSLLRDETFDQPLIRKAISDLLFGVYDDSLYSAQLEQREAEKSFEAIKSQLKNLLLVFDETEQEIDMAAINKTLREKEEQFNKVLVTLENYDSTRQITDNPIAEEIEQKRLVYVRLQAQFANLKNAVISLELDIEDSRHFIRNLENRVAAFDEATLTRETLKELKISHCPLCLTPIADNANENTCRLCKQNISLETQQTKLLRMKQELLFQIKESKTLLQSKEEEYSHAVRQIPEALEQVNIAKLTLEEEIKRVRTKRDRYLDDLLIKKGHLDGELSALHKQAKALLVLEKLKKQQSEAGALIHSLGISIASKRNKQIARLSQAIDKVEMFASGLLKSDLRREEIFMAPERITLDFEKNTFAVNNRNQFSASSIVYLKNCLHYAIFFASLELEFFRYPRFILCDNMEDKGMEEIRSMNFQKKIVDIAKMYPGKFQIIFTTSMIAPELDNTPLCVGEKYSGENKALKIG